MSFCYITWVIKILPSIAEAYWIFTADALTAALIVFQSQHVSLKTTSLCLILHSYFFKDGFFYLITL